MDFYTLGGLALFAVSAIAVIYTINQRRPIKYVEQLRPRDRRINRMNAQRETDLSVFCKYKNDVWRFIKKGTAWTGVHGVTPFTRFFGVETKAWTTIFKDAAKFEVSISEYLKDLWGEDFYRTIPDKQRSDIEDTKVGVTVEPVTDFTDLQWSEVSAEQVTEEDQRTLVKNSAGATKDGNTMKDMYRMAMVFALGAFFMYFVLRQGYI